MYLAHKQLNRGILACDLLFSPYEEIMAKPAGMAFQFLKEGK